MIFLDPTVDLTFRKLFANQAKKEIVICFLNAILDRSGKNTIVDVVITDPFNLPDTPKLKVSSVDVRCTDEAGKSYIVEMQVDSQADYPNRAQYYASVAISHQLPARGKYEQVKPVYFIGILDFIAFDGDKEKKQKKEYLTKHKMLNAETLQQELKLMEFYFIELPKFQRTLEQLDDVVDKWTYLLKNASTLDAVPQQFKNPIELEEAMDTLQQGTFSRAELNTYERFLDARRVEESVLKTAAAEGRAEGRAEGEMNTKRAIARQLLAAKMISLDIAKLTELSVEEVEKLK